MKHIMIIFVAIFSMSFSHAADKWIKGEGKGQITLTNVTGQSHGVNITPALGFDAAPFLQVADESWMVPEFLEALAQTVPRDEELVSLLQLTEQDFSEHTKWQVEFLRLDMIPKKNLTKKQSKAWEIFNKNWKVKGGPIDIASKDLSLTFDVETYYEVWDFDIVVGQGEGGEWRSSCYAGFAQKFDLIVSGVKFDGDKSLTKDVQGIIGTKFMSNRSYGSGKTFLKMQIDNQDPDFAAKCKAQKDLL